MDFVVSCGMKGRRPCYGYANADEQGPHTNGEDHQTRRRRATDSKASHKHTNGGDHQMRRDEVTQRRTAAEGEGGLDEFRGASKAAHERRRPPDAAATRGRNASEHTPGGDHQTRPERNGPEHTTGGDHQTRKGGGESNWQARKLISRRRPDRR